MLVQILRRSCAFLSSVYWNWKCNYWRLLQYLRSFPDASRMRPRCLSQASQMPPSSPLTSEASQVPPTRLCEREIFVCFYCLKMTCKIAAKKLHNQCLFGNFFGSDFTENHVRAECSFACFFWQFVNSFGAPWPSIRSRWRSRNAVSQIWELLLNAKQM